jgi:hypothetical protein
MLNFFGKFYAGIVYQLFNFQFLGPYAGHRNKAQLSNSWNMLVMVQQR